MTPKVDIEPRRGNTERWTGNLVDVEDVDGVYKTNSGEEVTLEMNPQESTNERPAVVVKSEIFRGHLRTPLVGEPYFGKERRTIFLSKKDGRGAQCLTTDTKIVIQLNK